MTEYVAARYTGPIDTLRTDPLVLAAKYSELVTVAAVIPPVVTRLAVSLDAC